MWTFMSPVVKSSSGVSWGLPLGGEWTLPANHVSREVPNKEWTFGERNLAQWTIVSMVFVKGSKTGVWMPIQWDTYSHRLQFLNPTSMSPHVYTPSQFSSCCGSCNKSNISRSLMWMWLEIFLSLSKIWDHVDCSTHEVVRCPWWKADNGKSWGEWPELECPYSYIGIHSLPPLVVSIWDQNTEGKCWVMNWTALLAEIYHLRSQQLFLGEKDWRESEEGRERGRLRVRERVRARSREREGEGERGRERERQIERETGREKINSDSIKSQGQDLRV